MLTVGQIAYFRGGVDRNVEPDLPVRKIKKTRLILDSRIELTDNELKVARERYTEGQREIRDEIERKKLEKQNEKILEDIIWGVPQGREWLPSD